MGAYRPGGFSNLPPVVKNIVIINVLFFLATWYLGESGIDLVRIFGLHYPASEFFRPWQFVTHMFMHGGFYHILLNMFIFWMFGRVLENIWGGQRLLIYFFATGLGAAALHLGVNWWQYSDMQAAATAFSNTPTPDLFVQFMTDYFPDVKPKISELIVYFREHPDSTDAKMAAVKQVQILVQETINIPTVGASGAVYGVLMAFGMLFPNQIIYLYFAIPIKAKYFVVLLIGLELFMGIGVKGDGIAHFAHLGGMVFGYILLKIWQSRRNTFY